MVEYGVNLFSVLSCFNFTLNQAFAKVFNTTPDDLDMHMIYDVSHNVAKIEEHVSFFLYIYIFMFKYSIYLFHCFTMFQVEPTNQLVNYANIG